MSDRRARLAFAVAASQAVVMETLTILRGATFSVSGVDGDIVPGGHQGIFHRDVRVVSQMALLIGGRAPHLLSGRRDGAGRAQWVYALAPGADGKPTAVLSRTREVADTVRERLEVRGDGQRVTGEISIVLASDFANLLELKDGGPAGTPHAYEVDGVECRASSGGVELSVRAGGAAVSACPEGFSWRFDVARGAAVTCDLVLGVQSPRDEPRPGFSPGRAPSDFLEVRSGDDRWTRSVSSALEDLRGLLVDVPSMGLRYIGAGAPWYMALFGRDTLLTGWESLVAGTPRTLDVLGALARWQGGASDERTGEQPGKILHELRTGLVGVFGVEPGAAYYGSADATPLFVMLLAEAYRWGADAGVVRGLLPAARRALAWCFEHGDPDHDGFVEYAPDPGSLVNQGWKDSGDALVHADARLAPPPIALAEVQGYTYAACLALAELESRLGVASDAAALRDRAAALRARFEAAFWLPDRGLVALALDGEKRPLAVATSNIGHVLWSGILAPGTGAAAAERLARGDLATTWGLRTLARGERAYDPLGYHVGSVWPHDTAIGVAGLVRYGLLTEAARLAGGVLRVAEAFGWRLPELLAGLDASDAPHPVPYPHACSPQAWSAAAPLLLLRSMLRLDPDVPAGVVHVAPVLPWREELEVRGIPLGTAGTLGLRVRGRSVEVLEAPRGIDVVTEPLVRD
jgi:glycogen debranching enzyme